MRFRRATSSDRASAGEVLRGAGWWPTGTYSPGSALDWLTMIQAHRVTLAECRRGSGDVDYLVAVIVGPREGPGALDVAHRCDPGRGGDNDPIQIRTIRRHINGKASEGDLRRTARPEIRWHPPKRGSE